MKPFDLIPYIEEDGTAREDSYRICVNGVTYARSWTHQSVNECAYYLKDEETTTAVLSCTHGELNGPTYISLSLEPSEWKGHRVSVSVGQQQQRVETKDGLRHWEYTGHECVSFQFVPMAEHWKNQFSFIEFAPIVHRFADEEKLDYLTFRLDDDDDDLSFVLEYYLTKQSIPLGTIIESFQRKTFEILGKALEFAKAEIANNTVFATFEFPEELQTACAQYLLYFSQFLKDLGISAESDLTEDVGRVLFSVTPTDGTEALERIREALDLYLTLPSSPIIKSEDSFAAQRLEYQIEALKFNVRALESERRMLQREIEHQDLLLRDQGEIIRRSQTSDNVMIESRIPPPGETKETKKKVFGLTKIKKLEDFGIAIDLGALFEKISED